MKKGFDIDLSSIGHKKSKRDPEDLSIAIPTDKPLSFLERGIFSCTGDEFMTWTKSVYPSANIEKELFDFSNPLYKRNRLSAFNQIQQYYFSLLSKSQQEAIN